MDSNFKQRVSANTASRSRGAIRPSFAIKFLALHQQGRRTARRPMRPIAACAMVVVERTRVSQVTPDCNWHSPRNGLRLIRASPGDQLSNAHIFCCRDWRRLISLGVQIRGGWSYADGSWTGTVWRPSPGKRGAALHAALVRGPCSCIRRLAGRRAQEVRFTRFLRNDRVGAQRWRAMRRRAQRRVLLVARLSWSRIAANWRWGGGVRGTMVTDLLARAVEYVGCCCMQRLRSMPTMARCWALSIPRSGIGTRAW